jgi:hypothetical protein
VDALDTCHFAIQSKQHLRPRSNRTGRRLQGEVVIGSDFDALRASRRNLVRHQWAGVPLIAFREIWLMACGTVLTAIALAYTVVAWTAVRKRIPVFASAATRAPQATVLKALCGAEHGLYEHLRSFCDQDHAEFQIIFGVADANDEAVAIVRQLQRDFPAADLHLVIDGKQHGANRKVSNLINMACYARYDYLVVADSDIHVSRDYLSKVTLPLLDPTVGIVTCPYRGCPRAGLWQAPDPSLSVQRLPCGGRCCRRLVVSTPSPISWLTITAWASLPAG